MIVQLEKYVVIEPSQFGQVAKKVDYLRVEFETSFYVFFKFRVKSTFLRLKKLPKGRCLSGDPFDDLPATDEKNIIEHFY